jgi:hypothetical protein
MARSMLEPSGKKGRQGTVDPELFKMALGGPEVDAAFFFPTDAASWENDRYLLHRQRRSAVRGTAKGVRFLPTGPAPAQADRPDPKRRPPDLLRLVRGIRALRQGVIAFPNLALSEDLLVCHPDVAGVRPIRFGLVCADKLRLEENAAWECHRQILRGIGLAGLKAKPERPARGGLAGLEQWAAEVQLRRRRRWWPYVLAGLILLLLVGLIWRAGPEGRFVDMAVKTRSFVVIVDKSGSMAEHFEEVRRQAAQLLESMQSSRLLMWERTYADFILFDEQPISLLEGLCALDEQVTASLNARLAEVQADGADTRLAPAVALAAAEISAHKRPTTVLILSDGEDYTIAGMLADVEGLRASFGGVEVVVHTASPRLLLPGAAPQPVTDGEQQLAELSRILNGRFGPQRKE